jgi:hypothetical protein
MSEPREFVPWGGSSPFAIAQQMLSRAKDAATEGAELHLIACLVTVSEAGNYVYKVLNSPIKTEVALMAAHEIKAHVLEGTKG